MQIYRLMSFRSVPLRVQSTLDQREEYLVKGDEISCTEVGPHYKTLDFDSRSGTVSLEPRPSRLLGVDCTWLGDAWREILTNSVAGRRFPSQGG